MNCCLNLARAVALCGACLVLVGSEGCQLSGANSADPNKTFKAASNPNLCLDVAGGVSQDGGAVVLAPCASVATQNWQLSKGLLQTQGLCVSAANANAYAGAAVQLATCVPEDALQMWTYAAGQLILQQSVYCMAMSGQPPQAGQAIQLDVCALNANEQLFDSVTSSDNSAEPNSALRRIDIINGTSQSLWVNNGISSFVLGPNAKTTGYLPSGWSGRIWARSDCSIKGASADCTNNIPLTLVEVTFDGGSGASVQDFYDLSLVDGFNIAVKLVPQGGQGSCYAPSCNANILAMCAPDLQQLDAQGHIIACLSGCSRYHTDAACCQNANDTPASCPQPPAAVAFKQACPDAYSYPYDDSTSTWTCAKPTGYTITFSLP